MKTLHLSLVGQRPNQHPLPAEQGQHLPTGMLSTLSLPDHDRRAGQGNVRPGFDGLFDTYTVTDVNWLVLHLHVASQLKVLTGHHRFAPQNVGRAG